jgi:hypothetical protein
MSITRRELRAGGTTYVPQFVLRVAGTPAEVWDENDEMVYFGSSTIGATIELPLAASNPGRIVAVRRIYDGLSYTGSVVVNRQGADTIESGTTFLINNLNPYYFQSDGGTAWFLVGGPLPIRVVALVDAATIAIDTATGGEVFQADITLGGNRTLGLPTNAIDGRRMILRVKQDGTGTRTLAYNAIYRFPLVIPSPTLSTAANAQDILAFQYNAAAVKWDCVAVILGYT